MTPKSDPVPTTPVTQSAQVTESDMVALKLSTKAQLDAMPKRKVRLHKEVKGAPNYETVQINGYLIQIMRGVEVEVPSVVYDILDEGGLL